jgi:HAD superfamily hydrolase (TIGR01549 family)
MNTYKILFTGVGRRVELMQAFHQAANNLNINLKIYGADMAGTAPALAFCDYTRRVCGMRDADYIPQLLQICQKDRIDLLIPTIDTDLAVLSQNVERFDAVGTKVLVSAADKIAICRDKNCTADFFESCGLKAPRTVNDYHKYDGSYPCFIKPKDGSSSINAFKVQNESELKVYAEQIEDYIVQPFIEGCEYTVDIFCDYEGNPITITPRIRVAVRAGEVLKTEISMDEKIIEECRRLIEGFKPCGPMTVQLIRQNTTGDDYYIEINPRFGGGAPLSMKAGARSAEAILKILSGETAGYTEIVDDGAIFSRFDQSVCISEGKRTQPVKGIIFDLDDTLYSEKQYVKCGYKAVAKQLADELLADKLWTYFEEGKPAIDVLLNELGCIERKEECLEVYREHMPELTLYEGVEEMFQKLQNDGIKVGIITDGRVSGQKKKIQALGLEKLVKDIIITDELGGVQFRKPCDIAFRIMQRRWRIPFEQIVYVGDNAGKDFQAPKQLGMKSLYFKNKTGLYGGDDLSIPTITQISDVSAVI